MAGIEQSEPIAAESIQELVDTFLAEQRAAAGTPSGRLTFVQSVQAFIAASPWLTHEHMPGITALLATAEQLDRQVTAALVGQFNGAFRDLRAQADPRPTGSTGPTGDPVEDALRGAGK